jgi:hypothetical protein
MKIPLSQEELDNRVAKITAFPTWAKLEESMRGGYVPTINQYPTDQVEEILAKAELVRAIKAAGLRVYEGAEKENYKEARGKYLSAVKELREARAKLKAAGKVLSSKNRRVIRRLASKKVEILTDPA